MARLHEYQAKALLAKAGITVPRGEPAATPAEAERAARALGGPVVVKIQAWTTGRKALGGVAFADTPAKAAEEARRMLGMKVGQFPVERVLVEEQLRPARELFVSLTIDDAARSPLMLLAQSGGSGIEERAEAVARIACHVTGGPDMAEVRKFVDGADLPASSRAEVVAAVGRVFAAARANDARSVEINPLAVLADGRVVALDARATIDDYAVYRHPELGIEIARELDHPPTPLEKIAYRVEQEDHRGTFFFAQMHTERTPSVSEGPASAGHVRSGGGLIGFHGAGGGGSMMSMDAITNEGFTLANFCDTSGNPSPAKVYRAARVILSQPGLLGYFGSGSGVANQEQYWSAYGLAKAFWELNLDIPAVIRLGGNTEDRAVEILESACKDLPATVEGYRKNDPPAKIARRFAELVAGMSRDRQGGARAVEGTGWTPRAPRRPVFVGKPGTPSFEVKGGRVWIDAASWKANAPAIIARANGLLRDDAGRPALAVSPQEFLAKDSDMIACEVECRRDGIDGLFVELDMPAG
jgi:succinyl-CoA synthetase beta subunit